MSRHSDDIIACFYTSNELFTKLEHGLEQYQDWMVLGQVNIEQLVETHLHEVADWESNFRALKIRGQDAEKLPRSVEMKPMFSTNSVHLSVRFATDALS